MLDRLTPRPGARRRPKRVGRGPGSGTGKTCGRGVKGQGKRSAGTPKQPFFEGGQMPMTRRLPKRGFRSRSREVIEIVNLGALERFGEGASVDPAALVQRGLVRGVGPVKLLGEGEPPRKLSVRVHRISAGARRKLEAAGGSVELVE
jgi:large subunit ribosomal protein L15